MNLLKSASSALKLLVGWPLAIISLLFLVQTFLPKIGAILPSLSSINFSTISLSILFFNLYFFIRGFIWEEILVNQGYKLDFKKSIVCWGLSELKRYTPGNIWSFLARAVSFEKLGVKKTDTGKGLIYEAEFFLAGGFVSSVFGIGILFNFLPNFPLEKFVQPFIFIFLILFLCLFFFRKHKILPQVEFSDRLKLSFYSFLAVSAFGIGTYFSIGSIFYLDIRNFIQLSSFFSLSLLIGYLSLITPTGLGIREAVLTGGLSNFMGIAPAAFSSIFSRVILIISELIFLFLVWLWNGLKSKLIIRIETRIFENRHLLLLFLFIIFYILYFSYVSILRYDNFYTGRFDLGNMDQTIWNTIHGRIFQLTNPDGTEIVSRLASHADFFLILISPLYFLWQNPKILLIFQSLVVSLGAIFIFLLSKDVLKNRNVSLILGVSYLLNPIIEFPNLFDFHSVVMATTFVLGAFYFLNKSKIIPGFLLLFLAAITKEDVWLIVSLTGLFLFFKKNFKILGGLLFFTGAFVFYYLIWTAIPSQRGDAEHFAIKYYSEFGDSPTSILKNIIFDPFKTFTDILHKENLIYLIRLFLPLGFIPFLAPLYLIFTIPNFGINLLSNNLNLHLIFFQYSATIVAFLYISAIFGIKNISKFTPAIKPIFYAFFVLTCTLYSSWDFGPLPFSKYANVDVFTNPLPYREKIAMYIKSIPKNKSVAATNNLGSHLSQRKYIYTIPYGLDRADYIMFFIRGPYEIIPDDLKILKNVEKDKNYIKIFQKEEFIVFKRI